MNKFIIYFVATHLSIQITVYNSKIEEQVSGGTK